ncbi:hypothetical protein AZF37_04020 [endosymbiont 'TC1' of Trimyema compressum]|uniref:XRE family transcriptional regulator n=1 Tax=endosymbiont 'TC1' of Trimyema compressum TaxID=243899 RepID=UPI0007F05A14|nr:XRE family transcriptional regulator [endosymbiont 'TC1' of Trimyema compressum]AMP20449.1 hypothetical protein AZF37_04020 [endosymbiont 'TC1' of Trimyema compressum]
MRKILANNIKYLRNKNKLTQTKMGELIAKQATAISEWENGKNIPRSGTLYQLASLFEFSIHDLLETDLTSEYSTSNNTSNNQKNNYLIPICNTAFARLKEPKQINVKIVSLDLDYYSQYGNNIFAVLVEGNSMLPRILPGDILIIKEQSEVNNGDIALLSVQNEMIIKEYRKHPEGIQLISWNTTFYTLKEIEALEIKVIGKAIKIIGNL